MLIRLGDPSKQIDLLVFLRNSGIFALEQVGEDSIRVFEVDESHLREVVAAWEGLHPRNRAQIEP